MAGYLRGEHVKSSDGAHRLALYLWEPGDRPRGIVQLVHGMREHLGRYADFAEYLSRHGMIVCGHDHLGHGLTAEPGGDYGFIAGEHGSRILVRDCGRVTKWITGRYPELPVFLLGHSMGSLIARIYVLHHADALAGFICMGTSGEKASASVVRALAGIAARFGGADGKSRLTDFLMDRNSRRRLRGTEHDMAWLSRDTEVVEAYLADPHTAARFTNAAYGDLFEIQMAACSKDWAERVNRDLPILLLSGEQDPIGDFGRGVVQVYDRLKMAGMTDVRCKLYEGARHELLQELNREEVYFDIMDWIETHLPDPFDTKMFL